MRFPGFSRPQRSFGTVLGLLLAALVFQLAAPDSDLTRLITVLLQSFVVIAALFAAGAEPRVIGVVTALAALLVGVALFAILGDALGAVIPRASALALVLIAPVAIAVGAWRDLRAKGYVNLETVLAGLCLYLLLGLTFAFLFALIEEIGPDPFFVGVAEGTPNDFLYFSLSTLTTTGYGDLTAATELARTFSVVEALAGQIYLVTVIALLVSNLRRSHSAEPSGR